MMKQTHHAKELDTPKKEETLQHENNRKPLNLHDSIGELRLRARRGGSRCARELEIVKDKSS